jgi:uncharacterized membrane protein
MDISQKHLATVWFIGAGLLFFLLLVQMMGGVYGDKVGEAWSWLLPTFMPTLLLIIGALVKKARQASLEDSTVDHFMYILSFYLSIAYLIIVILTLLVGNLSEQAPLEQLRHSNLYLAPVQGLVNLALGAFFVSQK